VQKISPFLQIVCKKINMPKIKPPNPHFKPQIGTLLCFLILFSNQKQGNFNKGFELKQFEHLFRQHKLMVI